MSTIRLVQQDLYAALVSFPYPVIAVLAGDAIGAGFLLATLCDFMVLNKEASYGYTDEQNGVYPTVAETVLFGERFGEVLAQDFLYVSKTATGKQLIERGWTCPIVPAGEVEAVAEELASELAEKSQMALGTVEAASDTPPGGCGERTETGRDGGHSGRSFRRGASQGREHDGPGLGYTVGRRVGESRTECGT